MIHDHSVASALLKTRPRKSHDSNKIGYFVLEIMSTSLSVWFCYLVWVQSPSCESTSGCKGAVFGRTSVRQEEAFNGFRILSHSTCSWQVKCTSGAIFFFSWVCLGGQVRTRLFSLTLGMTGASLG